LRATYILHKQKCFFVVLNFRISNTLIINISGAWGGRGIEIRYGIDHLIPSGVQDVYLEF